MLVPVRVIPRSSRNILEWEEGSIKARLTAPPVDGAANTALIALLSDALSLPMRAIDIVRGTTGRQKLVDIEGLSPEEIARRLAAFNNKKR
ncbi:DUF167 domain-containing protein [Ktedonospora formicarum]|uniref:UPF0235 protein KSX_28570 n=1 Tax=Ktedonospora formicarum TaxID=2778364 RepID=A0A8J3I4J8_9CHLR|nr:DUF167 domain-containing protein [Ktedonospora formicarum]GHO44694.1 UPF0235 protein [Ktedonospora formicarum]